MTNLAFKMDPQWLAAKRDEYAAQARAKHGADVDVRALFIEQTRKVLLGNDRTKYLRFGPYWWAVKRILLAADIGLGGTYVETTWADEYACADDELTLVAAWSFSEDNTGRFGVLTREYDLGVMDFVLYDGDMEEPK
jgi:hypothetical protein